MAIQESQQVLHARYKKGQLCQRKNPDVSRAYNSEGDMNFQTQNYYKRAPELAKNLASCTKGPT